MTSIIAAITAILGKVFSDVLKEILFTEKQTYEIHSSTGSYHADPSDYIINHEWLLDEDEN